MTQQKWKCFVEPLVGSINGVISVEQRSYKVYDRISLNARETIDEYVRQT